MKFFKRRRRAREIADWVMRYNYHDCFVIRDADVETLHIAIRILHRETSCKYTLEDGDTIRIRKVNRNYNY